MAGSGGPRDAEASIQILVPVYNEGDAALVLHERLGDAGVAYDALRFVYDFPEDTTLPFIERLRAEDSRVEGVMNTLGRGALNALRFGFSRCGSGPVVVVMGDLSDRLSIIPEMVERWRDGATLVSPSRYMTGGVQEGGGLVKKNLSRLAGRSLRLLGFPTSDPTNNFKLYDGAWLREQRIESHGGFEVALELCYKAYRAGRRIDELPTVWQDRSQGESRFRLFAWLPHYLRWYFRALGLLVSRGLGFGRLHS